MSTIFYNSIGNDTLAIQESFFKVTLFKLALAEKEPIFSNMTYLYFIFILYIIILFFLNLVPLSLLFSIQKITK